MLTEADMAGAGRRRRAVKGAMRDSWAAYVRSAWGQDELLPVSGFGTQAFCNTGALAEPTRNRPPLLPACTAFQRPVVLALLAQQLGGFSAAGIELTVEILGCRRIAAGCAGHAVDHGHEAGVCTGPGLGCPKHDVHRVRLPAHLSLHPWVHGKRCD